MLDVHGMVVMNTIDEIVSHLDEGPDLIRDILKELGQSHAKFGSQMLAEDFWVGFQTSRNVSRKLSGSQCMMFLNSTLSKPSLKP